MQATGNNRYHAMGVTLNKQFANNYSFLASFDADYRDLRDNAPRNPNEALYGPGTATGNNYGVQNFQFARAVVELRDAPERHLPAAVGHVVLVVIHRAERRLLLPRSADPRRASTPTSRSASRRRPDATRGRRSGTTASRRGSRRWKNQSIEGSFDLFNTLNINTITAQTNRVGSTAYLQPTDIIAPRIARLGVKYRF